jgi:hypothetical protein
MKIATLAALLGACAFATPVVAQAPAAIVEEVTGSSSGTSFMDYVETGRTINLAPGDSVVLSYLKSCIREVISGGAVTVGVDQSEGPSAKIERSKVDCDANRMMLAPRQASDAAGLVFRKLSPETMNELIPQFTLYGLCPIFDLKGDGTLVVVRLDKPGERIVLGVSQRQRMHDALVDFASTGLSLSAGGVYAATWRTQQVIFRVDRDAKLGQTPIVGRWLRLEPAS